VSTVGVLYVYGEGIACGQGPNYKCEDLRPVLSLAGINIQRIWTGCDQSIAIDEKGQVFVCGSNGKGKLGLGEIKEIDIFERLAVFDDHPVIDVSIGLLHTAFITHNFELWTCGDGRFLQTLNATEETVKVPKPAELAIGKSVMAVSCGLAFTIIAEDLREVPRHPGRAHFGLVGKSEIDPLRDA
jgi:alpha-tubulin suppressor-like RCC1 family protein